MTTTDNEQPTAGELEAVIAFALSEGEHDSSYYDGQVNPAITAGRKAFTAYRQHVAELERENEKLRAFVERLSKALPEDVFIRLIETYYKDLSSAEDKLSRYVLQARELIASLQEAM